MKEKTSSFRPSIGGALIVVMFVILCIVTFATLSLVSANAEYKLSEKTASRTTEYYNACNYAEELLSQADAAIASAHRSAGPQDYAAQLSSNLAPLGITVTADGAEVILDFKINNTNIIKI